MNHTIKCLLLGAGIFLISCGRQSGKDETASPSDAAVPSSNPYIADSNALFALLAPEKTHIDFSNTLTEGLNTNVLVYEYFYNGGGWPSAT